MWFYLHEFPRVVKFIETKSGMVVTSVWKKGNGELLFNEYRVSFWEDEKVLKMDGDDSCTAMWMYLKCHWMVCVKIIKMVHFVLVYLPQ